MTFNYARVRRVACRWACPPMFLLVLPSLLVAQVPFGFMDGPTNNSTYAGAFNVTGWALNTATVGVDHVSVYRDAVIGEPPGLVFIHNGTFVPGARPDVAMAYPGYYHNNYGWGTLVLSNMLPNSNGNGQHGNGTYTFYAFAYNAPLPGQTQGTSAQIGVAHITVNNAGSHIPFGTLDTPGDGATISGSDYVSFGWALTPQTATIPTDGSTISLIVDGQILGHPTYNNYRSDIAMLFPGYANSGGAVGFYHLNTTTLSNGTLHAISWWVVDNAGHYDPMGIGSRYFLVSNPHPNDNAAALLSFKNCVGPTNDDSTLATCPLAAGTYTLSESIPILRRNVIVTGSTDLSQKTFLVRGHDFVQPMMELGSQNDVPNTVPLIGVKIQYLTFCSGSTIHQGDPNNPCLPITQGNATTMCEMNGLPCLDLSIKNTGPGQSWASSAGAPFYNTGPYNVEVSYSNFEDSSSNHPIFISPGAISPGVRQMVSDVYFHDNVISAGGVVIGASDGTNWDDYTQCDYWQAAKGTVFEDDNRNGSATGDPPTAIGPATPRDIRFSNNTFYPRDSGISGQGRYIGIYNNTIIDTVGGAGGGGSIEQEVCSTQVKIIGNTLIGGGPGISGMELYARNLTVSGNTASGFTFEGIGLLSTYNASATGNHLYNNDLVSHTGNYVNGNIKARTVWQDQKCTPAYAGSSNPTIPRIGPITCDAWRDTQGLTIQNNDSQPAAPGVGIVQAGVFLPDHEGSSSYVALASISGNNFNVGDVPAVDPNNNAHNVTNQHSFGQVVYHPRISLDTSLISYPTASAADCHFPSYNNDCTYPSTDPDLLPQSISIFPEGNQPLGMPLGATDPGVGKPEGTNRRFFRFGANDPNGASDLAHIEGFLSTAACPALATILNSPYDNTSPSGLAGPYATAPQTYTGSPCNPHGQPVGPPISPIYYCHFLFASSDGGPTGTIYLDDTNPANIGYWFAGNSPLGTTGQTISNGVCTIHASTSSIQHVPSYCQTCAAKDVVVILDIELLQTANGQPPDTWFMYELAVNNLGLNQGYWSLWGYWQVKPIQ